MILYPKMLLNSVTEITPQILEKNNIKALIVDLDNTLINCKQQISKEVENWVEEMKKNKIKLFILSNSGNKEKVEKFSKKLQIQYSNLAKKPLKKGFINAQNILNEKTENIATVGDQIFTDIVGGNRCKMFTILVEPIQKKEYWHTRWKRPLERIVKKRYKKSQKK